MLITGVVAHAQTPSVIGFWQFEKIYQDENLDSTGAAMASLFFKDLSFQFNEDKTCILRMMGKEDPATWKFKDTKTQTIEVTPNKGKATVIETIALSENEWIVRFVNAQFVLSRVVEETAE
ncbi:MAG: hypothetical protein RLZZ337_289 [Bacteroidota bacterium]